MTRPAGPPPAGDPEAAARLAPALRARLAATGGRLPLALLDVDLTLVDNAPRNRAIWAAWAHGVRDRWPGAEAAAVRAQTMPIVFGVRDNLAALGVPDDALAEDALRFWLDAFFSDRFLGHDAPLPGAVDAALALRAAGATLVYLTARPATMAAGTVASLARFGLPVGVPGTALVMKEDPREGDGAYKERALGWIGALGSPILCADNEPGHVNAMHAAFPEALAVLVDTRHSAGAPALTPAALRVPSLADAVLAPDPPGAAPR